MISARVVADTKSEHGHRLTSMLITFPRIILSEFNTHRMFCLSGETMLEFDLPSGSRNAKYRRVYKMKLEDFVKKWIYGAKERNNNTLKSINANIDKLTDNYYSIKTASNLLGYKNPSNLYNACRFGKLKAVKLGKSWFASTEDIVKYANRKQKNRQPLKNILSKMKIRQYNETTGKIQTATVLNCFVSGKKEVFEITTESGFKVKASKDHKFLTSDGWKKLEDVECLTDELIVQKRGKFDQDYLDKNRLINVDGKWKQTYNKKIKPILLEKQNGRCAECKSKNPTEVHHVIPGYINSSLLFEESNCVLLCKKCHSNAHSVQGWQGGTFLVGTPDKVMSIENKGYEETYDLEINGEFPNFIANGIIVHNSKNTSSSRAIPFEKMVEAVTSNPFIPHAWQKEHKGMQGSEYFTDEVEIRKNITAWIHARDAAIKQAEILNENKVTKQLANRLLEPFQWVTMIVSSTEWDNFFKLRCPEYRVYGLTFKSKKECVDFFKGSDQVLEIQDWKTVNRGQAEYHMMDLAEKMYDALNRSVPLSNEWHIPFYDEIEAAYFDKMDFLRTTENYLRISTAWCARTSYTVFDKSDKKHSLDKDYELYNKLLTSGHWSPFEHCAKELTGSEYNCRYRGTGIYHQPGWCDNFRGFQSYRNIIQNG